MEKIFIDVCHPRIFAEQKLWDMVHDELIGTYSKSITQQNPGVTRINNNVSLTCMAIISPAMGWFEIFKVPMFDLDEVVGSNDEYIDNSSVRVSHLFNNTWMCRYPRQHKVMFDRRSDFNDT